MTGETLHSTNSPDRASQAEDAPPFNPEAAKAAREQAIEEVERKGEFIREAGRPQREHAARLLEEAELLERDGNEYDARKKRKTAEIVSGFAEQAEEEAERIYDGYRPGRLEENPERAHEMAIAGDESETKIVKLKKEAKEAFLSGQRTEARSLLEKAKKERQKTRKEEAEAGLAYDDESSFFDELEKI